MCTTETGTLYPSRVVARVIPLSMSGTSLDSQVQIHDPGIGIPRVLDWVMPSGILGDAMQRNTRCYGPWAMHRYTAALHSGCCGLLLGPASPNHVRPWVVIHVVTFR